MQVLFSQWEKRKQKRKEKKETALLHLAETVKTITANIASHYWMGSSEYCKNSAFDSLNEVCQTKCKKNITFGLDKN